MIDPVKEKIVELIPEIQSTQHTFFGNNLRCKACGEPTTGYCKKGEIRSITFADVIHAYNLANGRQGNWDVKDWHIFLYPLLQTVGGWNLNLDYDNQKQEVKDFIGKLLVI